MLAAVMALVLGACASQPPVPDWRVNAQAASERATSAYLAGNTRVANLEFDRMRKEVARTGDAGLMARAELLRCSTQVASLVFEPCSGFEALRADAAAPEIAYANYGRAVAAAGSSPCCRAPSNPLPSACCRVERSVPAMQPFCPQWISRCLAWWPPRCGFKRGKGTRP
jgi:hypothetical protein